MKQESRDFSRGRFKQPVKHHYRELSGKPYLWTLEVSAFGQRRCMKQESLSVRQLTMEGKGNSL